MCVSHLPIASRAVTFTISLRRKEFFAFCEDKNNSKSLYIPPRRHNVHFFCTCKALGKDAGKWLTHVLKHIGSAKPEDLHRLLPGEWTE